MRDEGAVTADDGEPLARPMPQMVPAYLRGIAERALGAERARVTAVETPAQWAPLKRRYMAAYRAALGRFPARTPLKARSMGRVECAEAAVEKVVFQSRPGFYVTADLYLPKPARAERRPAVLLVSGHHEGGKADPDSPHQTIALSLARLGVVTLAMDPVGQGERRFYLDARGQRAEACTTEHCLLGFPCLLTGTNLAQYFVWDAVRAVDYVVSRPEVDPARLAMTGYSGGGTQTFHTMPLEPRLALAAPTCFVTSRLAFLGNAADSEQCLYGAIARGLDHGTIAALCAPRAYQVQATRGDFFPIEGAHDSAALAEHVYKALGAGDRIRLVEADGGHGYYAPLRQAFAEAMDRWLDAGTTGAADAEAHVEPVPPDELLCTPTGQVRTSLAGARWVGDFNRERADRVAPRRKPPVDAADTARLQGEVRASMRRVLGLGRMRRPRTSLRETVEGVETVWIESEPGITVPCAILSQPAGRHPAAILLEDEHGGLVADQTRAEEHAEAERLREALAARQWVVMSPYVRGTGPSALAPPPASAYDLLLDAEGVAAQDASMCGTSLFGGRVRDVLQVLACLRTRPDVDARGVTLVGWGQGGLLALTAAALDPSVARCAVLGGLATYRSLVDGPRFAHPPSTFVWDVLSHYDLPDAAACVAPRPLLAAGPVDAMQAPLGADALAPTYAAAAAAYGAVGAAEALTVTTDRMALRRWLGL